MKQGRGRPRNYDPEVALQAALEVFWKKGFSRTSLDDLSRATAMKRPSLYAAFGDKKAIYLKATERFRVLMRERFGAALASSSDPILALAAMFLAGLETYVAENGQGCMAVSTTAVEAVAEPEMRADLQVSIGELETGLAQWGTALQERGVLRTETDVKMLAWHASATVFSLGIRARAGVPATALVEMCEAAARSIVEPWLRSGSKTGSTD